MKSISLKAALLSVSALALAMPLSNADAAGFYIQEQSITGLGSAFSGSVTNLNDPSTIFFNPAGMTKLAGEQAQVNVHILVPNSELTDTGSTAPGGATAISGGDGGNPYSPTGVPNAFYSKQINDNIWFGLSVTAPFGLANDYQNDWFGRYDSISTDLTVIDIQPTLAYKFSDMLSVGAGVNIQRSTATLTNAASGGGTEGIGTLKGDDIAVGYTVGIQAKPFSGTTFGASYHSTANHELEGRLSVAGSTNADFNVLGHAALDLPDVATFGVAQEVSSKWTIQGQATWFGWNNFQSIKTVTEETFSVLGGAITRTAGSVVSNTLQNYQTTWAYALGAEYEYSEDVTLRAGVQFDETPTTDLYRTSRTPDGDRTWLSGGASFKYNENITFDVAGTYIWIDDEEINVNRNNSFSTAVQTSVQADTEGNVGIISLGMTYKF